MLTSAQLATLKTGIQADATANALYVAGNDSGVAARMNEAGTGTIWRPDLSLLEIANAVVWADFDALATGKKQTFQAMLATGALDATKASIRAGFSSVFGGASASATNLTTAAQRTPTRAEMLFTLSQVCSLFGLLVTDADVAATRSV